MTKDRLQDLPLSVLLELSRKENLTIDESESRDAIIEDLMEAYDEDRRERESLQNLILKIEETKFASLSRPSSAPAFTVEPVIPAGYDETSVDFVLRDPAWALVLWEVRRKDLDAWSAEASYRGLVLRVHEHPAPGLPSSTFFPIPISQGAGSRYLHLPTPGRWYSLELHAQFERETRVIARTVPLQAPPELPDDPKDRPGLTAAQVRLLDVSGSAICETARERNAELPSGYPQRIGDWDDSELQDTAE